MKKIAVLLVLAVMLCPAFNRTANAEGDPLYTLSVSKSNGGILSLINLYGNVVYNETLDETCSVVCASLTCYGQGYTRCRVPSDAGNYATATQCRSLPAGMATVVNNLLEQSELQMQNGVKIGAQSKKIIPQSNSVKVRTAGNQTVRRPMYVYSSRWNFNDSGEGTVKISLYETDASLLGL
ncbi:MAG: hypothetical protein J5644_04035 [Bacteroidales bacterium]|nr:hypothetical protein [Bacteroidales bacterium]